MKHFGVTATRYGATKAQLATLRRLLMDEYSAEPVMMHHGDCVGGDAQAQDAAVAVLPHVTIKVHPSTTTAMRAGKPYTFAAEPRPPLVRNHDIVDESEKLFAMPRGFEEELHSGTWATVRYARSKNKPLVIIWPSGLTSTGNET